MHENDEFWKYLWVPLSGKPLNKGCSLLSKDKRDREHGFAWRWKPLSMYGNLATVRVVIYHPVCSVLHSCSNHSTESRRNIELSSRDMPRNDKGIHLVEWENENDPMNHGTIQTRYIRLGVGWGDPHLPDLGSISQPFVSWSPPSPCWMHEGQL